jgi:Bacteriophage replication gene A protein (GPA)
MSVRVSQAGWERRCCEDFPGRVADLMRAGHAARIGQRAEPRDSPLYAANQWLGSLARELRHAHLSHAFDETAIRDAAENYSRLCSRMHTLEARRDFGRWVGVALPAGRHMTDAGFTARLNDPMWWRRALRKTWTRAAENALRRIGLIRRGRDPYASEYAVRHRRAQHRRTRDFLEGHAVRNEDGEQLPLLPLAEHSLSNPALRRAEFMTRARGFEELARDHGHVAEFVTLTAPSFFHAQLARGGGANPSYRRAIVREAQAWLCRVWARVRARLRRLSIAMYGFRVAEPHHDGTPHWHLLLFVAPVHVDDMRRVISDYWLAEYPDEPGAREHRVRFKTIDPDKSACGYIAKYVAKNIDGEGIGEDEDYETGAEVAESIARVDAWASIHGIRQFQQIGGCAVGLYREARRLREPVADVDLERARCAADRGDWRAFQYACSGDGGLVHRRRTSLKLERVATLERNRYGEQRPPRVVGLRYASAVAITRPHRWKIERQAAPAISPARCEARRMGSPSVSSSVFFSDLGPVAITARSFGDPRGWANPLESSRAGP